MKILFATTSLPHEQTTGGEIASRAFIDAMRNAGHLVQVFGFTRSPATAPLGSTRVATRAVETESAGHAKYLWLARAVLMGRPYISEKFRSARYLRAMRTATRLVKADLLVIDHAQMGWLLPAARHFASRVVLIAHNHEARLYAAEAARQRGWMKRAALQRDSALVDALEHRLAREVDQVWTLSASDQAMFSVMTDPAKISLMPLPGRSMGPRPLEATAGFDVGLLGTWSWEVNGKGLDWFVRAVMPLLPDHVQVRVAGRGSERVNGLRPNLAGLGFIEDPARFMQEARVLAIPTIAGAGVQLKTIEAIASGTRMVSTRLGLRGLDPLPPYIAVADQPAAFAASLLAQLRLPAPPQDLARAWVKSRQDAFHLQLTSQLQQLEAAPARKALRTAERA